jgi:hypothetical protein
MTVWEWIEASSSAVAAGSLLIGLVVSRVLSEIARSAALLADDQWVSAPLTRAKASR